MNRDCEDCCVGIRRLRSALCVVSPLPKVVMDMAGLLVGLNDGNF